MGHTRRFGELPAGDMGRSVAFVWLLLAIGGPESNVQGLSCLKGTGAPARTRALLTGRRPAGCTHKRARAFACGCRTVRATHAQPRTYPHAGSGGNVLAQNCSSTATACYSIITAVYNSSTGLNDTTFAPPVNSSWPNTLLARGCYDPSLSQYLQCPLTPEKHASIPPAFASSEYDVLQYNVTSKSLVFYLCCNTTLCNNISASGGLDDGKALAPPPPADALPPDFMFDDAPVVNPTPGELSTMDIIFLGIVGLAGLSGGLIVDLAATNRGPFKES